MELADKKRKALAPPPPPLRSSTSALTILRFDVSFHPLRESYVKRPRNFRHPPFFLHLSAPPPPSPNPGVEAVLFKLNCRYLSNDEINKLLTFSLTPRRARAYLARAISTLDFRRLLRMKRRGGGGGGEREWLIRPNTYLHDTRDTLPLREGGDVTRAIRWIRPDFSTVVFVFVTVYGLSENC